MGRLARNGLIIKISKNINIGAQLLLLTIRISFLLHEKAIQKQPFADILQNRCF